MVPLLLFASISTALASSGSGAEGASQQIARDARNGEFISKHYPPGALKRGEQGRVAFQLTIEPDGSIGACDVTESSGFPGLDQETCEVMVHYARLQPVRNDEGRAVRATTPGHIVWKLPNGATKIASATAPTTALKPDKVICKRTQSTGSLISKTKQCMTRSEWARTEQNTRDQMDSLQFRGNVDCKSSGTC